MLQLRCQDATPAHAVTCHLFDLTAGMKNMAFSSTKTMCTKAHFGICSAALQRAWARPQNSSWLLLKTRMLTSSSADSQ